jgi:hypothetical protein
LGRRSYLPGWQRFSAGLFGSYLGDYWNFLAAVWYLESVCNIDFIADRRTGTDTLPG